MCRRNFVDEIAHYLPKADLLALRRVSKEVSARCDRAVLSHIPNILAVLLCSRRSLATAELISRNPTWRKTIQSVSFCQDHLSEAVLADGSYSSHNFDDSPRSSTAARAVRRRRRKAYKVLLADQNEMFRTDDDARMILGNLSNLKDNRVEVEVKVVDAWSMGPSEMGRLQTELEGDWSLLGDWENHRPV